MSEEVISNDKQGIGWAPPKRGASPYEVIVPILSTSESGSWKLEGTGFFLMTKQGVRVVTCAHVVKRLPGERLCAIAIATTRERERVNQQTLPIKSAYCSNRIDVGWLDVELPANTPSLPLSSRNPFFDEEIFCWDYSPARSEPPIDGKEVFNADTWFHKGNPARFYFKNGIGHFNTSFPTMQGSSGSPIFILNEGRFAVAGMVVGNQETTLSPSILAQRVTVKDGDNFEENISYYLPFGVALASDSLQKGFRQFFEPDIVTFP